MELQKENIIKSLRQEMGSAGGKKTLAKYGKKHFSAAGKKGMKKRWGNRKKLLVDNKGL